MLCTGIFKHEYFMFNIIVEQECPDGVGEREKEHKKYDLLILMTMTNEADIFTLWQWMFGIWWAGKYVHCQSHSHSHA